MDSARTTTTAQHRLDRAEATLEEIMVLAAEKQKFGYLPATKQRALIAIAKLAIEYFDSEEVAETQAQP